MFGGAVLVLFGPGQLHGGGEAGRADTAREMVKTAQKRIRATPIPGTVRPIRKGTGMQSLVLELRRRKVPRVAAFHAAAGWLLVQSATLERSFECPHRACKLAA